MNKANNYLLLLISLFVLAVSTQAQTKKRAGYIVGKPDYMRTISYGNKQFSASETGNTENVTLGSVNFPDGKKGYGIVLFDSVFTRLGYASFNFNELQTFTSENNQVKSYAGTSGYDKYYFFSYVKTPFDEVLVSQLNVMDQLTGEISIIDDLTSRHLFLSGLTFDYSKNVLYCINTKYAGTDLIKYDLKKGVCSLVGSFGSTIMSVLATTYKGELYGISSEGWLYRIDKENGALERIGNTQFSPDYIQSMEFDHSDETLYWASFSENGGGLRSVDINSGIATKLGNLGHGAELAGLYIPFTLPSFDVPDWPVEVSGLPDSNGSTNVTLRWKNPLRDFGGSSLTSLIKTEVYRNGELIHTVNAPVVGKPEQWTDEEAMNGYTTYKIVSSNQAGTGIPAQVTAYVGKDLPGPVSNLVACRKSGTMMISWQEPVVGSKGGRFEKSSLTYKITRYPDEKVLTTDCTESFFSDTESTSRLSKVYYAVQGVNKDGEGDLVSSNIVMQGLSESVPFLSTMDNREDFDRWTVIDNNFDSYTWNWIGGANGEPEGKDIKAAIYWFNPDRNIFPDEWLISPPITFKKATSYKLTFDLRASLPECPERIKVYIGSTPGLENMNEFADFTVSDTAGFNHYRALLPGVTETGEYYIAFQACSEPEMYAMEMKNVRIDENRAGAIEGNVMGDGLPIVGAQIKIRGDEEERRFITDDSGHYFIDYIEPGQYILEISKHGFYDLEKDVTIAEFQHLTLEIPLNSIPIQKMTGRVVDSQGKVVSDALVYLKGYDRHSAKSVENGTFELNRIYRTGNYLLMIMKSGYVLATRTLDLTNTSQDIGDLILDDKILPPTAVKAEEAETVMNISWKIPVDTHLFSYDNGIATGMLGVDAEDPTRAKAVLGNVFRTPAILKGMSFYLPSQGDSNDRLCTYIFDLDEKGDPLSVPLYISEPMSCLVDTWTTFTFPAAVEAPNGFMVAIGYPGTMVLICRDGNDNIPKASQCMSSNYEKGGFFYMEQGMANGRMMIRAEGAMFDFPNVAVLEGDPLKSVINHERIRTIDKEFPARSLVTAIPNVWQESFGGISHSYLVWRMRAGEENAPAGWALLTENKISDTELSDETWDALPQGIYRYAVQAVYANGQKSVAVFADSLYHKMVASVVIKVKSEEGTSLANADVVLTGNDGGQVYRSKSDDGGNAVFPVQKGIYSLLITLPGFNDIKVEHIDLSTVEKYEPQAFVMIRQLIPARDLVIEKGQSDSDWTLYWNMTDVTDGFESHSDFAVNSAGTVGWQYIDGDEKNTTALSGTTFSHAGDKMAYIVFNPYQTEPPMSQSGMTSGIDPHSGEKFLASMAATGIGTDFCNDDYIISPALRYSEPFVLKFWAKTYNKRYGEEVIRVGYSVEGTGKSDFIWLESNLKLPYVWTEYHFDLPADARFVAINCISPDKYMMMLDDIFVGRDGNAIPSGARSYEVYLDNKRIGTTSAFSYKLSVNEAGRHTVGVKIVYDSGVSELTTLDFTVSGSGVKDAGYPGILLYPNPAKDRIYIKGDYDEIRIFHLSGKLQGIYKGESSLSVIGWIKGVYLVQIINSDRVTMKKLEIK